MINHYLLLGGDDSVKLYRVLVGPDGIPVGEIEIATATDVAQGTLIVNALNAYVGPELRPGAQANYANFEEKP